MTDRPKAPEPVIIVGYWLTEARTTLQAAQSAYGSDYVVQGLAYLTSAYAAVPAARAALADKLENRQMWPSDGLADIMEACIALAKLPSDTMELSLIEHMIGRGHQKLAVMLHRMGFEPITNADFQALRDEHGFPGGGGGR